MRRAWIVLFVVLLAIPAAAQVQTPEEITRRNLLAMIAGHPDQNLKQDMTRWYGEGKFLIKIGPDVSVLAVAMAENTKKPWIRLPILQVGPSFFRSSHLSGIDSKDPTAVRMEKDAQLYHEYIHLTDHFSGKHPLDFSQNNPLTGRRAGHFWNTELDGYVGQWKFLKRMGYTRLFAVPEFAALPEWEKFLRSMNSRMKANPDYPKYRQYWDKSFRYDLKHPRF